ncbi:MAG: DUF1338 domain-containing protein [Oceanococcus sp.]
MNITTFFEALWADYLNFTPSAGKIHQLFGGGHEIANDHIALRTFNTPDLGLDAMEPLFLAMGYQRGGEYAFKAKKLLARHYEHPDATVPKVFISELLLQEFSDELQGQVAEQLRQMGELGAPDASLLYSGRHWDLSHAQYQSLLAESEYAAWLSAFGFRANHFTVNVNVLPGFASVAQVNAMLKAEGFALNASGGEIKGSPEVMLEQSSTMADKVAVEFRDGEFEIPACFYEFAYRYPQADGSLYQGFVEASADKIFESTNVGV